VLKEAVEFDNVGMIERTVQFDFPFELFHHFVFQHFGFDDFLQRHDEPRLYMLCQVNLTKLAFAQLFVDFESVDGVYF
jgi:hypothetical protein